MSSEQLEIYSIVLGYYASRRDKGPYLLPDRFDEILTKIQEISNLEQNELEFSDCMLNTILNYADSLIKNSWNTKTCTIFMTNFFIGYDFYQVKESNKLINNINSKKHKKIQKKLNEII